MTVLLVAGFDCFARFDPDGKPSLSMIPLGFRPELQFRNYAVTTGFCLFTFVTLLVVLIYLYTNPSEAVELLPFFRTTLRKCVPETPI